MAVREVPDKASVLQAEVAALDELLTVQEKVVIEQSAKLEQAVHQARIAQQQWQSTFDAIDDLVAVVGKDYRILAANEAVRKSAPGKQVVGMHCYELFHGTTCPRRDCPFEESRRTGKPAHGEWSDPHFQERWINVSTFPVLEEDGSVGSLVHIIRDITDRKRAEEKLKRYAAQLEQANEEVKQFAYIVSHDLRAPLVNLRGFAAELRSSLNILAPALDAVLPHLGEEQAKAATLAMREDMPEDLRFIDSSVTQMNCLVNALLTLSRMGRRELHFETLDVKSIVATALNSLAHEIEATQTRVCVGSLPDVVGDRTSMEQIMSNILGNAVKYLETGRPGKIEVAGQRDDAATTFIIRDNGRGIAKEDMPKVFAPFRRAGKQNVPGEGMGMAYVQTLIRRHDGWISCESELGVGTTFTFSLPHHLVPGDGHVRGTNV